MNKGIKTIKGLSLLFLLLLGSCVSSEKEHELEQYINQIKKRPSRPIEPLPTFVVPAKFVYPEQDNRRSPFKQKEIVVAKVEEMAPDTNRPKQPLEQFPLDALKFVGILEQGSTIWGLITIPTGEVVRVRPGDYMGKDFGKIIRITNTTLTLEETARVSGKWQKRKTVLNLNTGSENNNSNIEK